MKSFNSKTVMIAIILCVSVIGVMGQTTPDQDRGPEAAYAFVYLGDLHFDKKSHHDLEWVQANKPNDIRQIEDYSRITEAHTPNLLKRIQASIESSHGRIQMVVQGGDLTEGLCGSRELQEIQFKDVKALIRHYLPETPFIAAKGNHDVTGPGAREAYDSVMLPWLSEDCRKPIRSASFHVMKGPDLFVFFDAYHNKDLDWLETTLTRNAHRRVFVVIHPPVVPYTARATWHIYSKDNEKETRERFLNILGASQAVVLTAHLHKYHVLVRSTPKGPFVQVSVNSVISSPTASIKDPLEGVERYGSSLVELEPEFQPETLEQRKAIIENEKPHMTYFDYAGFPGYAVVHVSDADVTLEVHQGDSDRVWKTVSLNTVLGR
jgi:hypothetical protein